MNAGIVFLDSVGILAAINKADAWHKDASPVYAQLRQRNVRPVTTNLVLAECANAVSRLAVRSQICDLAEHLEMRGCVIVPNPEDWKAAWAAYRRGEAGDAGLVDHLSFIVMRKLGVRQAFTNDRQFRAAGFETLF